MTVYPSLTMTSRAQTPRHLPLRTLTLALALALPAYAAAQHAGDDKDRHQGPEDLDAVLRLSGNFARQRTAKGGHRTLDIMHVATAVHLGAKQFLTFDSRQRQLAKYAGLRVPL